MSLCSSCFKNKVKQNKTKQSSFCYCLVQHASKSTAQGQLNSESLGQSIPCIFLWLFSNTIVCAVSGLRSSHLEVLLENAANLLPQDQSSILPKVIL